MKKYSGEIDISEMYKDSFKECAVTDCKSVEEFLEKYHTDKHEEYLKQGYDCSREEYLKTLLYVHQVNIYNNGYTVIYGGDSKTGEDVAFFKDDKNIW